MMLVATLGILFTSAVLIIFTALNTGIDAWVRHSAEFTDKAKDNLERNFMFTDTRRLLIVYVSIMLIIPAVLYIMGFGWLIILLSVMFVFQFPKVYFKKMAKRRADSINAALPDALAQIAGAMQAGSTFVSALQAMVDEQNSPISQEFSLMLREQHMGARLEEALDNLGERVQTEEMDLVISATLISQDIGGNLSEIFSRLSDTLRRKIEMEGKIKSLTAQGVLQGYVVTALPFFILLALTGLEPEATIPMFTSLLGWLFLFTILVLQLIGGAMIKKIVSIDI